MGLKCDDDDNVAFPGGEVNCVHCSICLDAVADDGNRSWAKLLCGHKFHLDCIGSAFNAKGAMQCPNCRKIEKGQWLFPNGGCSFPDYSMEDWTHDEDLYELGYPEMSFGAHWSPFSGELANIPNPFEERGYSSAAYHEPLGQHAAFAEHTAISTHPCPYFAYLGPFPPLSSFPPPSSFINNRFADSTNSSHWNGQSLRREVHEYVPLPAMDLHHPVWENPTHPPSMSGGHIGNADVAPLGSFIQRSSRNNSDISRSGSSGHPYHMDSSSSRSGGSVSSSLLSPYPGSNMRMHDRVQALQAYYQQQTGHQSPLHSPLASTGNRQSSGQRSVSHSGMVASSHGLSGGFFFSPVSSPDEYVEDRESVSTGQFQSWERDHLPSLLLSRSDQDTGWEHAQHSNLMPESVARRSSFRRRGSERSSSYSRS